MRASSRPVPVAGPTVRPTSSGTSPLRAGQPLRSSCPEAVGADGEGAGRDRRTGPRRATVATPGRRAPTDGKAPLIGGSWTGRAVIRRVPPPGHSFRAQGAYTPLRGRSKVGTDTE